MNKKISAIAVVALLMLATAQLSVAVPTTNTINLCEKTISIGNSWGICDPTNPGEKAQGTFAYNIAGSMLIFTASATGLHSEPGTEYSLIYYKDTDPAHVLPSIKVVNVLATATSEDISGVNSISFVSPEGGLNFGDDIPSSDDINFNYKGKIWIVPTSKINGDFTLQWTGYADGATMTDYLFESDNIAQTEGDVTTVQDRMGGIRYDYIAPDSMVGSVGVCNLPTVGVTLTSNTLEFGKLYAGGVATASNTITITETPEIDCPSQEIPVTLTIDNDSWSNTVGSIATTNDLSADPVVVTNTIDTDVEFTVTVGNTVPAGSYTQTITVTGTY